MQKSAMQCCDLHCFLISCHPFAKTLYVCSVFWP